MYNKKIEHNTKKSQTATEYIIIVAVVIVIALVVVQIMGGFPGIGTSTSKKVSDYKLSSSDQIGIDKYYFGTGAALFSLKNNYFESLRVENFTVNGIVCDFNNTNIYGTNSVGLPLTLNPGQSVTINCSSSNFSNTPNDVTPQVSITYTNPTTGATYTSSLSGSSVSGNSGGTSETILSNSSVPFVIEDNSYTFRMTTDNATLRFGSTDIVVVSISSPDGITWDYLGAIGSPTNITDTSPRYYTINSINYTISFVGIGSRIFSVVVGGNGTPVNITSSLRTGLVAYYALDGNTTDGSGNNNDGTNNDANYTASGQVGGAYDFDGTASYIRSSYTLSSNTPTTYSLWVRFDNFSGGRAILKTGNYRSLFMTGGSIYFGGTTSLLSNANQGIYAGTLLSGVTNLSQWTHIVGIWNTSTSKLYINGQLVTEATTGSGNENADFSDTTIGRGINGYGNFKGSIDEVQIYNRSLSESEISLLYNNGTGRSLSPSGAYAPNCTIGQTSCSGTNFLNCSNGNWVNNGDVSGYCGYISLSSLRTGLVAYYPLDGNTSDDSTYANHATSNGSTYTPTGKIGGAYSFSGSSSFLDAGSSSSLDEVGNFTHTGWVYFNAGGTGALDPVIMKNVNGFYYLARTKSTKKISVSSHNIQADVLMGPTLNDGQWYHFAFTRAGTLLSLYINGSLYNSTTGTSSSYSGASLWMAGFPVAGNYQYTNGKLDEIQIYNRALSATEISYIYNNGTGRSLSPSGAYAPNCTISQTNCSGTNYLTCSNGNWVNNGDVSGQCGYYDLSALRTGLVAYFALDGNTSDGSGNNNHGNNTGANYTTSGKVGGAYQFNGVNNYFNLGNYSAINFNNNNFTFSWWEYRTSNSNGQCAIVGDGSDGSIGGLNYIMGYSSGGGIISVYMSSNAVAWDIASGKSLGPVTLNQWNYFTVVREGNNFTNYKNGIQTGTWNSSLSIKNSATGLLIGKYFYSGVNYYFNGSIDEIKIHNRSLSASEISYLYNNGDGRSISLSGAQTPACGVGQTSCTGTNYLTCSNGNWVNNGNVGGLCGYVDISPLRTGLVAYWPLDSNYTDMSGNVNTLTQSNIIMNSSNGHVLGGTYFNGGNGYMQNTASNVGNFKSANFSISLWVKNLASVDGAVIRDGVGTGSKPSSVRWLLYNNGGFTFYHSTGSGGAWNMGGISCGSDLAQWQHIVITRRGNNWTCYNNNVSVGSAVSASNYNDLQDVVSMGRWGAYANMYLDEVIIYNRSLNTSEIDLLYNNGNGRSLVQ